MNTRKFTTLHVNNLKIDDLYALVLSTVKAALPQQNQLGVLPSAALVQLQTDNDVMETQMNRSRKEELTALIRSGDAERDGLFGETRKLVSAAVGSKDDTRRAAGEKLDIFFAPYRGLAREPLNTETGILGELLARYAADPALQQAAATVGIDGLLEKLRLANADVDDLYRERTAAEAAKTASSASSLKGGVVKAYERFCILVEQAVTLMPNDDLIALFNEMDKLRKKYAALPQKPDSGKGNEK